MYCGHSFYGGRVKAPASGFGVQIDVWGREGKGHIVTSIFAESAVIQTGFWVEFKRMLREVIEIVRERLHVELRACPECGSKLDLTKADDKGLIICEHCRSPIRLPESYKKD